MNWIISPQYESDSTPLKDACLWSLVWGVASVVSGCLFSDKFGCDLSAFNND